VIQIDKFFSKCYSVSRGVPQGSVIGPLLFILYINDISSVFDLLVNVSYCLFADDLVFFTNGNNLIEIESCLNVTLDKLNSYFVDQNLILSIKKTKCMLIHKTQTKVKDSINISFNCEKIEQVFVFRYLGVYIDSNFSFKNHAELVEKNLIRAINFVHRYKRFIPKHVFSLFVISYIYSIVDYCISIWGVVPPSVLNNLQNRINNLIITYKYPKFNLIYRKSIWSSTISDAQREKRDRLYREKKKINMNSLLSFYSLKTVEERYKCFTLLRFFKILKFNSGNLRNFVTSSRLVDSSRLIVPDHSLKFFQKNFFYRAVKLWNSLPFNLRCFKYSADNFRLLIYDYVLKLRSLDFLD